mmetsp:Transcript_153364/g.268102  ORF Transcript_153364/g.268102 Transcript_153364/m.268102 type:complete len:220 (+) Transcript_153364:1473-2132(+)
MRRPSWLMRMRWGSIRVRRCVCDTSTSHRRNSMSFATTHPVTGRPAPCAATLRPSMSCMVLEPGAAQMSSTRLSGRRSMNMGGTIETASWRRKLASAVSRITKRWNCFRLGYFFRARRLMSICHPMPAGYQTMGLGGAMTIVSSGLAAPSAGGGGEAAVVVSLSAALCSCGIHVVCSSFFRKLARVRSMRLMRNVVGRGARRASMNASHSASGTAPQVR